NSTSTQKSSPRRRRADSDLDRDSVRQRKSARTTASRDTSSIENSRFKSPATNQQLAELRKDRDERSDLTDAMAALRKARACQAIGCKNYRKGLCWIALHNNSHMRLLQDDLATWAGEILRGDAIATLPPMK